MKQTAELTGSARFIELEERHGAHNYHPLDVVVARAEGVWVWDVEGKRYLDFLAAYSAVNQGHCHPKLVKVMHEQSKRVTLTSRAFRNDQLGPFCEELTTLTGYHRVLPMNTGAEAVETAIKAARKWGYTVKGIPADEAEILVFAGNFHGRTTTIVGFSSEEDYRSGFGPFTPGFRILPYGDADAVAAAMHDKVAAVLVEPIQGEAGIVIPPAGFLDGEALRLRARRHPPRRRDCRQGTFRGHVPGFGDPGRRRGDGRLQTGRARLHLRRQPTRGRYRA
jgi:ornithine--oxo-acid transaminase